MLVDLILKTDVIRFKVITKEGFEKITSLFSDLRGEMEREFSDALVECLYEIKTGDQTYSGPSFSEFEKHYKSRYSADNIRVIIQASNPRQQLNPVMARVTLVLDRSQESSLSVMGANINWVNGVFSRFNTIMKNIPTRNVMLHSVIFEMFVQLMAVIILTTFSIFVANRVGPLVQTEYREVYVFVVIFLLLSNLWSYAARGLIAIRNEFYPVVDIIGAPRKQIVVAIASFLFLACGYWAVDYVLGLVLKGSGK